MDSRAKALSASVNSGRPIAIRLDELLALNEEMAAIVRAGMPLEGGLRDVARDLPGRLGKLSERLAAHLGQGASLADAFAAERDSVPEIYGDVVTAGLRSGRLSKALEGLTEYASGLVEMRRAIGLALIYPLLVAITAYGFILLFLSFVAPRLFSAFETFRIARPTFMHFIELISEWLPYWAPIPPVLLVLFLGWWLATGLGGKLQSGGIGSVMNAIPGLRGILRDARASSYAELLSLLAEHGVPLESALLIAGKASGDKRLLKASERASESLGQGVPAKEVFNRSGGFPPLLTWVLSLGDSGPGLPNALRHIGLTYRKRAAHRGEVFQRALPIFMVVAIGSGIAIFYALLLFLPVTALWDGISSPGID